MNGLLYILAPSAPSVVAATLSGTDDGSPIQLNEARMSADVRIVSKQKSNSSHANR